MGESGFHSKLYIPLTMCTVKERKGTTRYINNGLLHGLLVEQSRRSGGQEVRMCVLVLSKYHRLNQSHSVSKTLYWFILWRSTRIYLYCRVFVVYVFVWFLYDFYNIDVAISPLFL